MISCTRFTTPITEFYYKSLQLEKRSRPMKNQAMLFLFLKDNWYYISNDFMYTIHYTH